MIWRGSLTASPVVLFVYNRPQHLQHTIRSLQANIGASETDLYVFCDGAKSGKAKESVAKVRAIVEKIEGFKSVTITANTQNWGLARSVVNGVTQVLRTRRRVIVMEDDMVTSRYFLHYMNEALNCYEHEPRVISIHGYTYPVSDLPETFFMKGADCWGWATWKDRWQLFEEDGSMLLARLRSSQLLDRFDLYGACNYSAMLQGQIAGRIDSWAVRWYAIALLEDRLTLYPGRSLLANIGHDGSGLHSHSTDVFDIALSDECIHVGNIVIEENQAALLAVSQYLKSVKSGLYSRITNRLRQLTR